jgi:hypothetical protein
MIAPGALLASPNNIMLSFVLSYEKSLTDLSLDVSLVRLKSELWIGHVMPSARVICDGRD